MPGIDWEGLKALRAQFLSESAALSSNYWTPKLLEDYDATFATRIGWKWDAVLTQLKNRDFQLDPNVPCLDWGSGTGIASRRLLAHYPLLKSVSLFDRSLESVAFAKKKLTEEQPASIVSDWQKNSLPRFHLILSHVLNELSNEALESLLQLTKQAETVLWIEPGTKSVAGTLVKAREYLRSEFQVVAPCPHQNRCGLLDSGQESNWCHHFANVPTTAFQTAFWSTFSKELSIDLRSLPISFLVLQRKPLEKASNPIILLGRHTFQKGFAEMLTCSSTGINKMKLLERSHKKEIKALSKNCFLSWVKS